MARHIIPKRADAVGQQHLFGKAQNEQINALFHAVHRDAALQHMQPVRHIAVFHNGPGNQLREHHHIGAEVDEVVLGWHIAAVYVDGIAHRLEGVKADAQRQRQRKRGNGRAQQRVDVGDEEVGIFEEHQHANAAHNAVNKEEKPRALGMRKLFHAEAGGVVDENGKRHDGEQAHLAPGIEHKAAHKQHGVFPLGGRKVIQRQRNGQKAEQKQQGTENHGWGSF